MAPKRDANNAARATVRANYRTMAEETDGNVESSAPSLIPSNFAPLTDGATGSMLASKYLLNARDEPKDIFRFADWPISASSSSDSPCATFDGPFFSLVPSIENADVEPRNSLPFAAWDETLLGSSADILVAATDAKPYVHDSLREEIFLPREKADPASTEKESVFSVKATAPEEQKALSKHGGEIDSTAQPSATTDQRAASERLENTSTMEVCEKQTFVTDPSISNSYQTQSTSSKDNATKGAFDDSDKIDHTGVNPDMVVRDDANSEMIAAAAESGSGVAGGYGADFKEQTALDHSELTAHLKRLRQLFEEAASREEAALRREGEAVRRTEAATRREEASMRREEEASRREEDAIRREKESARREEDATRRVEEAIRCEEASMRREEAASCREEASVRREEGTARREEEAARCEKEAAHREEETLRREEAAVRREEESLRREEAALRREEESVRREEASVRREAVSTQRAKTAVFVGVFVSLVLGSLGFRR